MRIKCVAKCLQKGTWTVRADQYEIDLVGDSIEELLPILINEARHRLVLRSSPIPMDMDNGFVFLVDTSAVFDKLSLDDPPPVKVDIMAVTRGLARR